MKILKGLLLAAIVLLSQNVIAQTYAETALLFSRTKPAGSARILGMGGAQISLGGDVSSALSNPAGLGMYNRSEFSFTPAYNTVRTSGDYFMGDNVAPTTGNNDSRTGLSLPGFNMIFSREQDGRNGFVRGTFGITSSRINDFNLNYQYSGRNINTSLIDYFISQANGANEDQFSNNGDLNGTVTDLAYDNYLIGPRTVIDPNEDPTQYFTDITTIPVQSEIVKSKGAQNQWSFSYGANFNDKFFLGAGVGIASLNYQLQKTYSESFVDPNFTEFSLQESLQVRGTGLNFTVGGIARPIDGLQIGGSITTPTRYSINETYSAAMSSSWKNYEYLPGLFLNREGSNTGSLNSSYTLVTPWKLSAGASYVFGKHGLISADVEQVNYSSASYRSNTQGISFKSDNNEIKSAYRPVTNVRVGGEFRLSEWRFRGGYSIMPDPFSEKQNGTKKSISSVSAGIGYRVSKFYIDLAYIHSMGNNSYRPYTLDNPNSPLLSYSQTSDYMVATIGFTY